MSNNGYPFLTKAQIVEKIDADDDFVRECVLVMHSLQTEEEQETKSTKSRNRAGWMASHAVKGTEYATKLAAGESLSDDELADARSKVRSYRKQLAAHFRSQAAKADPELASKGATFGV
jgi:hypothetical protein